MRWLNAGISALVAYVFIRLIDLSLVGAACVFLVVFVVLSLTGSSFGGIWNSGLWTTLPARRCMGAVADAAMLIATAVASWWLVVDVIGVPGLSFRVLHFITRGRPEDAQFVGFVILIWTGMALLVPFRAIPWCKTVIGKAAAPFARLVRSRFVGMAARPVSAALDGSTLPGDATGTRSGSPCQGAWYYHAHLAEPLNEPLKLTSRTLPLQRITAHFVHFVIFEVPRFVTANPQ